MLSHSTILPPRHRSHSTGSQQSFDSGSSYRTAHSSQPPAPFSTHARVATTSPPASPATSQASSYRSAPSHLPAAHVVVDMTPTSPVGPAQRAENMRKIRGMIDAQINLFAQSLYEQAQRHQLVVPEDFVAPAGSDRSLAFIESIKGSLEPFATDMSRQLADDGFTDESVLDLFEAARRRDNYKGMAAAALERSPFILTMAILNLATPWTNIAAKADPSKGAGAGAFTNFLTNFAVGIVQQALGPYLTNVAFGSDPYATRPAASRMNPDVVAALKHVGPLTYAQRATTARAGALGIDLGTAANAGASVIMHAAGVPEHKAALAATGIGAIAQLGATSLTASAANERRERERFTRGFLAFLSRTNFRDVADQTREPLWSAQNLRHGALVALRLALAPFAAVLPDSLTRNVMGRPQRTTNVNRLPVADQFTGLEDLAGTAGFAVVGAAGGALDGFIVQRQPAASSSAQRTRLAGKRAGAKQLTTLATASTLSATNALVADRRARAAAAAASASASAAAASARSAAEEPTPAGDRAQGFEATRLPVATDDRAQGAGRRHSA